MKFRKVTAFLLSVALIGTTTVPVSAAGVQEESSVVCVMEEMDDNAEVDDSGWKDMKDDIDWENADEEEEDFDQEDAEDDVDWEDIEDDIDWDDTEEMEEDVDWEEEDVEDDVDWEDIEDDIDWDDTEEMEEDFDWVDEDDEDDDTDWEEVEEVFERVNTDDADDIVEPGREKNAFEGTDDPEDIDIPANPSTVCGMELPDPELYGNNDTDEEEQDSAGSNEETETEEVFSVDFKTGKKTNFQKVDYAESKDNTFAGTYESTKKIEVRSGAGEDKNVLTILDKDTQVRCYGYYTEEDDEKWLYVEYVYNGITETGFCNINCLK
ncbi:MAG: hypothetical protein HFI74_06775 [Lachnospiraceae bacterium]|jgi:hypothetical protein|nr:hypothetical protein [Lachnospiraceae bacterium]